MEPTANDVVSLFLHSTGTGPWLWDGVPQAVLGGGRKLAPANIGHAPHPPLSRGEPSGARADARHVLAQVSDEARDIHVFAHSYGGAIALELVPLLGQRLKSMFLFEPVLFGALASELPADPATAAEVKGLVEHPWFLRDEERGGREEWLEMFVDYWSRPGSWQRMPEEQREYSRRMGWKMFQEVRSCFFDITSFDELPLPNVPVTLVTGERSPRASRAMTAALARRAPWARVVDLPKTGHMAPLTHPALVHEAMAAHVSGLRAPAPAAR